MAIFLVLSIAARGTIGLRANDRNWREAEGRNRPKVDIPLVQRASNKRLRRLESCDNARVGILHEHLSSAGWTQQGDMRELTKALVSGSIIALAAGMAVQIVVVSVDYVWTATHTTWHEPLPKPPEPPAIPLTQEEMHLLGAKQAEYEYCNWNIADTAKGSDLAKRFVNSPDYPGKKEALQKIKESFRTADCDKMLNYIAELVRRVDD